jgi:hypothetical protein
MAASKNDKKKTSIVSTLFYEIIKVFVLVLVNPTITSRNCFSRKVCRVPNI